MTFHPENADKQAQGFRLYKAYFCIVIAQRILVRCCLGLSVVLTELTLRMLFGQSAKHFRKRVKKRDTVTIIFLFFSEGTLRCDHFIPPRLSE
jgi:hypothetical protein